MAVDRGRAPRDFLLSQTMGKRSGLFFVILLLASVTQVELAAAQSAGSDTVSYTHLDVYKRQQRN